jgi:hypothetical protein
MSDREFLVKKFDQMFYEYCIFKDSKEKCFNKENINNHKRKIIFKKDKE